MTGELEAWVSRHVYSDLLPKRSCQLLLGCGIGPRIIFQELPDQRRQS